MPLEIESKFLVRGNDWRTNHGVGIRQGYLNLDRERTVRVRIAGEKAFLTIKGINMGATRQEFEYEIPVADAEHLLKICEGSLIEKTRYKVEYENMIWEVDEFHGVNDGLVIAEIELETEDQAFAKPVWLGSEVTADLRFFNSNLAEKPYSSWSK
jgi:CYTH domain-containing protein